MAKSLTYLPGVDNANLSTLLQKLQRGAADCCFNAPGLTIGSSSKKAVKIGSTTYFYLDGSLCKKTTAEVALSGTVTNAKFNVFVITLKTDGTATARMGTEGATLGAVAWPTIPTDELMIGFAIINPTGTGNFVGATTDLDDATVVPNAAYVDLVAPWNPASNSL